MMNKGVARKLSSIKNRIESEYDTYIAESTEFNINIYKTDVIIDILELALTALPDSYPFHEHDKSWCWCWDELSSDAQDYVQEIRSVMNLFLKWKKE